MGSFRRPRRPSVALLQELPALKGGLPPDRLARLVDRVVRELLRELTACLRPARS